MKRAAALARATAPRIAVMGSIALAYSNASAQQPGTVLAEQKISSTTAGLDLPLEDGDSFGSAVVLIPDLDGDGRGELAVGARDSNFGAPDQGGVWILKTSGLSGFGSSKYTLSENLGGFTGTLAAQDHFGYSLAPLTLDRGPAIAVGATGDDDGGAAAGAIWIVPIGANGATGPALKIAADHPVFGGEVDPADALGSGLANLGDLDGDGTTELAIGAPGDDLGGNNKGAVWILSLTGAGVPTAAQRIGAQTGCFGGGLSSQDQFGAAVAALADLDGDGRAELAVGAPFDDDGGADRGAVWVLFLSADGKVDDRQKISSSAGSFDGQLGLNDRFGDSLGRLDLLHGTGTGAIAVGAPGDDDGGSSQGAAWILFLDDNGRVEDEQKISALTGGFGGDLTLGDFFSTSVAQVGDLDGDQKVDLAVGAIGDDDGGGNRGALWLLNMDGFLPALVTPYGCGFHPPGSLVLLSGPPVPGSVFTIGVDNPLGTQGAGSIPLALVSLSPDPLFPCGTPVPGWGMPGLGLAGELLVDLTELVLPVYGGLPWIGPGHPAPVPLPIPNFCGLLGVEAYVQGLLFDPIGAGGVTVGLADAFALRIGPI